MEGDINDLINRKTTYDKSILLYQYSQTQELAKIYNIGVIREKYDLANMKELNIVHHIEGIENITSIDDIKELYDL
jgi:hypothetical protein